MRLFSIMVKWAESFPKQIFFKSNFLEIIDRNICCGVYPDYVSILSTEIFKQRIFSSGAFVTFENPSIQTTRPLS